MEAIGYAVLYLLLLGLIFALAADMKEFADKTKDSINELRRKMDELHEKLDELQDGLRYRLGNNQGA